MDIGTKYDGGKNQLGLVLNDFANALWMVGEVGTYGAQKYAPHNWLGVHPDRYTDAMYRHLFLEVISEDGYDDESNLLHAAHAAWNALARLELEIRRREHR